MTPRSQRGLDMLTYRHIEHIVSEKLTEKRVGHKGILRGHHALGVNVDHGGLDFLTSGAKDS